MEKLKVSSELSAALDVWIVETTLKKTVRK